MRYLFFILLTFSLFTFSDIVSQNQEIEEKSHILHIQLNDWYESVNIEKTFQNVSTDKQRAVYKFSLPEKHQITAFYCYVEKDPSLNLRKMSQTFRPSEFHSLEETTSRNFVFHSRYLLPGEKQHILISHAAKIESQSLTNSYSYQKTKGSPFEFSLNYTSSVPISCFYYSHGELTQVNPKKITIQFKKVTNAYDEQLNFSFQRERFPIIQKKLKIEDTQTLEMKSRPIWVYGYNGYSCSTTSPIQWIGDHKHEAMVGEQLNFIVRFYKSQPIKYVGLVPEGKGLLRIVLPLDYLGKYIEFQSRQNQQEFDGIKYDLDIYANGEQVDKNIIKKEQGLGRYIWSTALVKNTQEVNIVAGYKFVTKPVGFIGMISRLPKIDASLLVKHWDRLRKKNKSLDSSFERIWQEEKLALQKLSEEELQILLSYIRKNLPSAVSQVESLLQKQK